MTLLYFQLDYVRKTERLQMNRGRKIRRRVNQNHVVPCEECAHPEHPSGLGTSILDTIPEAKGRFFL